MTARQLARRVLNVAHAGLNRGAVPLRRWYYTGSGGERIRGLPRRLSQALGLDDETAILSRRIEIGPGPHPTPGFLHMDIEPWGPHLEVVGPMWKLPFPDDWATEIRAIHALEHVHPSQLGDTLREWYRVLEPGGTVLISVPNGPAIMDAFKAAAVPEKWPLAGSILGMYCGPKLRDPRDLKVRSDHQIIFDWDLLVSVLQAAGFRDSEDLSDTWEDRHSEAWRPTVTDYSLVVQATAR